MMTRMMMLKNWFLIHRRRPDQALGQLRRVSIVRDSSRSLRMVLSGPTCELLLPQQFPNSPILNRIRQAERGLANFAQKVTDVNHPQKKMMRIQIPMASVYTIGEVDNHQPTPRGRPLVPHPILPPIIESRLSRAHPSCFPVELLVIVTQLQGLVKAQVPVRAQDVSQYLAQLDLH